MNRSELKAQATTNRAYAAAALNTYSATGRVSCLGTAAAHLAAAGRKEEEAAVMPYNFADHLAAAGRAMKRHDVPQFDDARAEALRQELLR
jgi:hypothetical protein